MFLELRHLKTIRAIEQTGSLAAAAERLHLTQSALSHQIRALESYYETPLFSRSSRRSTATCARSPAARPGACSSRWNAIPASPG